jgi:tetratricopeptide (TPR) repeat protein
MTPAVEALVERFDLEWDLGLDFEPFAGALDAVGIVIDGAGSGPAELGAEDWLVVGRCVLDRCDRLYDLGTATAWEELLVRLTSSPAATGERGARAWDALGRTSYRRGEYVTAAERFGTALGLVDEAGLEWLRPDVLSNWLRADDERLRLTNPPAMAARLRRYEDALTEAAARGPDPAAVRPADGREAVIRARGISSLHHNLAVSLRPAGQLERALVSHGEARAINVALGDGYRLGQTLLNEALVHEARFVASDDPAALERAIELLGQLRDERSWPRGKCFALQNLARISLRRQHDRAAANDLFAQAWRAYRELAGDRTRDAAFEEWTLLDWVEVAPDPLLPELFRSAYDTFHLMRGNLRHVLFRRSYAQRVVGVLERGLPHLEDHEAAAGYLGSWSAQEITDLAALTDVIDGQFVGADFSEHDRRIREALFAARDTGRRDIFRRLMPALHGRHGEYVRRIEAARLDAPPSSAPWTVGRLREVLPADAAAVAYFWPRSGDPRAYVVTRTGVLVRPLPRGDLEFSTEVRPSDRLRGELHRQLVAPWLDEVLESGVRSLYLVPYDRLFHLPLHCAQPEPEAPLLLHHPRLERVLYSVSLEELADSLGARQPGRFGPHGDTVRVRNGLAVVDPAGDLTRAGRPVFERLRTAIERLENAGMLTSLAGSSATHRGVLEALETAGWWFQFGHGNVVALAPETSEQLRNEARALQEDARIGAVLELADGILEDLDILLRCPARHLQFCLLSACVSVGMDVSAGNEIAGFVRALKVRRCGPIVLAFWQIPQDPGAAVMARLLRTLHAGPDPVDLSLALTRAVRDAGDPGLDLSPNRPNSGMFGIYV